MESAMENNDTRSGKKKSDMEEDWIDKLAIIFLKSVAVIIILFVLFILKAILLLFLELFYEELFYELFY